MNVSRIIPIGTSASRFHPHGSSLRTISTTPIHARIKPQSIISSRSLFFRPKSRFFSSSKSNPSATPTPTPRPNPTPHLSSPAPKPSLSQRLKQLSKDYGWTALAVYLGLSALDFPFCFLAVRVLGTDRIGAAEQWIVEWLWVLLGAIGLDSWAKQRKETKKMMKDQEEHQVREPEGALVGEVKSGHISAQHGESASIWTQLALAYAVHKSLIFFRVPITAAILPSVVKRLRAWGWNVGPKKIVK